MKARASKLGLVPNRELQMPESSFVPDIVLAESDQEFAAMISYALKQGGYRAQVFHTGPEVRDGLLTLPSGDGKRLVILAVDLAGLDGHTVHEQVAMARPGAFMFVFLTTRSSDADQIRAYAAGAVDYLVKPVSVPVLIAKVYVWMRLCSNDG